MTRDAPTWQKTAGGRLGLLLTLLFTVAGLQIAVLWRTAIPLGVPGEWSWTRIPFSGETALGWGLAGTLAVVYLAFVRAGAARQERCRRGESVAWIISLIVVGFLWLAAVQAAVPGIAGLPKAHFVLYYPRSSGYFWQARYDTETTAQFLTGYEARVSKGDYLHIGTHPPGLTLCFRGLSALCRAVPGVTDFLLWTQPETVREAADEIRARTAATPNPYTPTDVACIWLAALLVQGAAAATIAPLSALLRYNSDCVDAWYTAALWPLVPAVAVFLPKSDAMFPFLSMLAVCLWCSGWRRQSMWRCGLAGLVLFGGLLLSLAFVPVLVLLIAWTVLGALPRRNPGNSTVNLRRSSACMAAAAVAFVLPLIVSYAVWDLNLIRVWRWNLINHAQFYAHYHRTYGAWLLVNPLELGFAAGAPLATLALAGMARGWRTPLRNPMTLAFLVVWSLLWVSGKNMGEAARLWILLMPWLVLAVPGALRPADSNPNQVDLAGRARRHPVWVAVIAVQAVVCIATVTRVDGFQFGEFLPPAATSTP